MASIYAHAAEKRHESPGKIVNRLIELSATTAMLSLMTASANADPIELFDYGLNIDGFAT